MKTIWKFELNSETVQTVAMPTGATILDLQMQRDTLCIWAFLDSESPKVDRIFEIYGTGDVFTEGSNNVLDHIGTYQVGNGNFVFHVFERIQ
jgi:hypothetical protein